MHTLQQKHFCPNYQYDHFPKCILTGTKATRSKNRFHGQINLGNTAY